MCYANTFHVPFVLDDEGSIKYNSAIRDWTNLKGIWKFSPCRFVVYLTLALNYRFDRLRLPGYHAANLLIHLLTAFLLYALVRLLSRQSPALRTRAPQTEPRGRPAIGRPRWWVPEFHIALFAALIFVAHPVQTQAVTYVIQRTASLVTLFYLLAIVLYVKFRLSASRPDPTANGRGGVPYLWLAGSLLAVVAAMFTKQNALTLPLAIALVEFFFFTPSLTGFRRATPWLAPFAFTLLLIPATMMWSKDVNLGEISELGQETSLVSRSDYLLTQCNVVRTYLRLLVLPVGQNFDYDYPVSTSLLEPATALSLSLLLALFGFGIWLFRRNRLASFGIFFFFLTLTVESSVIPIVDVIFEHRVYLPSVGFFVAGAALLLSERRRLLVIGLAACLILAAGGTAFARNAVWRNTLTLWYDTARKSPNKARPQINLGAAYQERNRMAEAYRCYLRAYTLRRDDAHAMANLAGILTQQGKIDEAIQLCREALRINPKMAVAHLNLGVALAMRRHFQEAYEHFRAAAELRLDYVAAYYNWGYALLLGKHPQDAIAHFREALRVDPNYADAHLDWGNALVQLGKPAEAMPHFETALRLRPGWGEAAEALQAARSWIGKIQSPPKQ